jgi:predicted metal-dependent hydrolase
MDKDLNIHSVRFGSELIQFELKKKKRSTLGISVNPDLSVSVVAPYDAVLEKVLDRVKKKAPWILKQRFYFAQFLPDIVRKEYKSGESFHYLGRQYRLKVVKGGETSVSLAKGFLLVTLYGQGKNKDVKTALDDWYRSRAIAVFESRLERVLERFSGLGLPDFKLSVRKMSRRWGSCTKNRQIILNEDLVKAPTHCIDYVICHELVHLKVRNHTPEFFRLLSKVMPDWELRRKRLEKVVLGDSWAL